MKVSPDTRPQIQNGIKGIDANEKIWNLSGKKVLIGISNGNLLQQGEHLKNTLLLIKLLHKADAITLSESSALKVFSIASTIILNKSSDELNQKYQQAIIRQWENAELMTIWQDIQAARDKFIKSKGSKNISQLQQEAEQSNDFILGLVIRAHQTHEKWLVSNSYLTDTFKNENTVEIIHWLDQIQDKRTQSEITELIQLYSTEADDRNATVYKKAVDSSIESVLARKSIKPVESKSLIGKLNILYVIEESAVLKAWGQTELDKLPRYNFLFYVSGLNNAMFHILRKYIWLDAYDNDETTKLDCENLQFRKIDFEVPKHFAYKEFWDKLENKEIITTQKVSKPDKTFDSSLEEIYQYLTEVIKLSLDYFLSLLDKPYIYGFALKLIEYINLNFEQLEKILDTILPPSKESQSVEKAERLVLNHIRLKVLVFKDFDYAKTPLASERITLFGSRYISKVKSIKADRVSLTFEQEDSREALEENERQSTTCNIM